MTTYKRAILRDVLKSRKLTIDASPAGKRIGKIIIERISVYTKRDFFPMWLNYVHVTSKEHIVRQELLFETNQIYDKKRLEETERNLRAIRNFSMAIVVSVKSKRAGHVDVLVITKDLWSIRLNSNFSVVDKKLVFLFLQPTEENLLGLHQSVGINFVMNLATISFGPFYQIRRIRGTNLNLGTGGSIIFSRSGGKIEGGGASISMSSPLKSLRSKWGWSTGASFSLSTARLYFGTQLRTYDDPDTVENDAIAWMYKVRSVSGSVWMTRSFGLKIKQNFSLGLIFSLSRVTALDHVPERSLANFSRDVMPPSEDLYYPSLSYSIYSARYKSFQNVQTFGLTEDTQLGFLFSARLSWPSRIFGNKRNFIAGSASFRYIWAGSNSYLFRLSVGASTEYENDEFVNASTSAGFRFVSPMLYIGRLIWDVSYGVRYKNRRNARRSIGGDGRLRGFTSGEFIGQNIILSNLEFRSKSLNFYTIHFGFVLFYDAGDVFESHKKIRIKHGVGIGLRTLIPQWDRVVLRLDWGFPVSRKNRIWPGNIVFTMAQAF